MSVTPQDGLETDPRFPSGPWTGYYLQKELPGRQAMELILTFRSGEMTGEGRDRVGGFVLRGRYNLQDGTCHWNKRYVGMHDVYYKGFNEGKGIWGVWEIPSKAELERLHGGFHIWPQGMADPSSPHLAEEAELPVPTVEELSPAEPVAAPVSSSTQSAVTRP